MGKIGNFLSNVAEEARFTFLGDLGQPTYAQHVAELDKKYGAEWAAEDAARRWNHFKAGVTGARSEIPVRRGDD